MPVKIGENIEQKWKLANNRWESSSLKIQSSSSSSPSCNFSAEDSDGAKNGSSKSKWTETAFRRQESLRNSKKNIRDLVNEKASKCERKLNVYVSTFRHF